jgi:Fe-Mn family superoxide dismutase
MLLLLEQTWKVKTENILISLDLKNGAIRNNGGGFTTITFWTLMSPDGGGL